MIKKTMCIGLVFLVIQSGLVTASQKEFNEDYLIFEYPVTNHVPVGDGIDLVIENIYVWWVEKDKSLFVHLTERNAGTAPEEYTFYDPIFIYVYSDEKLIRIIEYGSSCGTGDMLGISFDEPVESKPQNVRMIIDATNTVPETDENNEYIIDRIPDAILVSGTVKDKYGKPKTDAETEVIITYRSRIYTFIPEWMLNTGFVEPDGSYEISIPPDEPFDTEKRYMIDLCEYDGLFIGNALLTLRTPPAKEGDSVELDLTTLTKVTSILKRNYIFLNLLIEKLLNQIPNIFRLLKL